MIFDVMLRIGQNAAGKDVMSVARVHDAVLSSYLRNVQDVGYYIISVIPLFKKKDTVIKKSYTEHYMDDLIDDESGEILIRDPHSPHRF